MWRGYGAGKSWRKILAGVALWVAICTPASLGQLATARKKATPGTAEKRAPVRLARPKLVVMLVVDQMRADYVDKFQGQWTGGLKRLVEQGAWFRDAAYPYAATETCVGHSTISTGAFPATHGMVANAWWDRGAQKMVTCTADPNVKNMGYLGASSKGGDSAWRMQVPAFAEELKFQTGSATRVVTFSLKARAAITMAGHQADAVTWFEGGAWATSSVYGTRPFIEAYLSAHPMQADYGKSWTLSLPESAYWYDEKATGAVPPPGWELTFPHPLKGEAGSKEPGEAFWAMDDQPVRGHLPDRACGKRGGLPGPRQRRWRGLSRCELLSVDYVGHAFGPRSREIKTCWCGSIGTSASCSGPWTKKWDEKITWWRSARTTVSCRCLKTCKKPALMPEFCTCLRCRKKLKKRSRL